MTGYFGSTDARPALKWALEVCIVPQPSTVQLLRVKKPALPKSDLYQKEHLIENPTLPTNILFKKQNFMQRYQPTQYTSEQPKKYNLRPRLPKNYTTFKHLAARQLLVQHIFLFQQSIIFLISTGKNKVLTNYDLVRMKNLVKLV